MSTQPKFDFCRDYAIDLKEPLAGSAPFAHYFVFITWPKTQWDSKALQSKGLPPELDLWQEQNKDSSNRTLIRLVQRPVECGATSCKVFVYPEAQMYVDVPPERLVDVLIHHFAQTPLSEFMPQAITTPQIFVCTHGRHDKCCAKYGQKVFKAFLETPEAQANQIDVWESSHLGGHRFAATAMVFPTGQTYGNIEESDVPKIIEALFKNQVCPSIYRGSCWIQKAEQSAEAYGWHYGIKQGFAGKIEVGDAIDLDENRKQVDVKLISNTDTKQLQITLKQILFEGPASCEDLEKNDQRWRWIQEKVAEI